MCSFRSADLRAIESTESQIAVRDAASAILAIRFIRLKKLENLSSVDSMASAMSKATISLLCIAVGIVSLTSAS